MIIGGGLIALPTTEVIGINVGDATLIISGGVMAIAGMLMSRSGAAVRDASTALTAES